MSPSPERVSALLPLLLFLVLFLGSGIYHTAIGTEFAFYQLKAPVAAIPAIVLAVLLNRRQINESIERFLHGAGHPNIILMCMVFMLAGAFAEVSKSVGSVDATVQLGLQFIPADFVVPALFIVSAFIATAMGTSMGTIAACAPIAIGFASAAGINPVFALGAVASGAMFGDNLSMISDTTIAATRSQGVSLRDKFRVNVWIALPAAFMTVVAYFMFAGDSHHISTQPQSAWLVLPYIAVFLLAFTGLHVLATLTIGVVLAGAVGLWLTPDYNLTSLNNAIYTGFVSLFEIMLLSMMIAGLSQLMQDQGGTQWLIQRIHRISQHLRLKAQRAGEFTISFLVILANIFVANNTVAIVITGDIAREIAQENQVDPRRSASYLDIFSCVVQGLIPYGAQILLASSLAKISPLDLAGAVFYCWALGLVAVISIIAGYPKLKPVHAINPAGK